jgi:lipopolysaccharide transport system permease protein
MHPVTDITRTAVAAADPDALHVATPAPLDSRASEPAATIILPESGWVSLELGELWRYRDLLWLLAWRDIAARYRQSVIGYGWAVLKPVLSMLIFTFLSYLQRIPSDGVPYPLFAYAAMLPWLYFSNTLVASTTSVVTSSNMLTKVYFPRMVLPLSSVVVGLVELAIQSIVLVGLVFYFNGAVVPPSAFGETSQEVSAPANDSPDAHVNASLAPTNDSSASRDADEPPRHWYFAFGWRTLCLPLFLALCVLSALAVGLWLTALNVKYRDIGQAVPFLVQAWMFLSPVMYPSSLVSPQWRPYYGLNPMAGVVEGFRWSILGTATPDWTMMCVSGLVVGLLLVSGLYYFRRLESSFADII